jgi:acetyl-CoA synthetase
MTISIAILPGRFPDKIQHRPRRQRRLGRARAGAVCLEHFSPDGNHLSMTYGELADALLILCQCARLAWVRRGDRVALLLPQSFETVIAHVAIYKMGAIAVPLALLVRRRGAGIPAQKMRVRPIVTNRLRA